MARRNLVFVSGQTYHVFNRSIGKAAIFSGKRELNKAIETLNYYRLPQSVSLSKTKLLPQISLSSKARTKDPLVEIYCYAFMPNHYHFLLKQLQDGGIVRFISNFQNSYAKHFNLRTDRQGGLFQSPFKAIHLETDEQFIHVSRYIHLNPVTSYLITFDLLAEYPYTTFCQYVGDANSKESFVNTEMLLGMVGSKEDYNEFVADQVRYQQELALIKDLLLDS